MCSPAANSAGLGKQYGTEKPLSGGCQVQTPEVSLVPCSCPSSPFQGSSLGTPTSVGEGGKRVKSLGTDLPQPRPTPSLEAIKAQLQMGDAASVRCAVEVRSSGPGWSWLVRGWKCLDPSMKQTWLQPQPGPTEVGLQRVRAGGTVSSGHLLGWGSRCRDEAAPDPSRTPGHGSHAPVL